MAVYEFGYTYSTRGVAVRDFDSDEEAEAWLDEIGEDGLLDFGYDVEVLDVEYDVDIAEVQEDGTRRSVWV